ncbi:hypothetical protein Pfo_031565 [Paulownia fortunei]|nr:hypothetical protein Pfo_031565 [Paulownia fortunei]
MVWHYLYAVCWDKPTEPVSGPQERPGSGKAGRVELRDYITVLRKSWALILVLALVGVAAAAGFSLLKKPVYSAEAQVFVSTEDPARADVLEPGVDADRAPAGHLVARARHERGPAVEDGVGDGADQHDPHLDHGQRHRSGAGDEHRECDLAEPDQRGRGHRGHRRERFEQRQADPGEAGAGAELARQPERPRQHRARSAHRSGARRRHRHQRQARRRRHRLRQQGVRATAHRAGRPAQPARRVVPHAPDEPAVPGPGYRLAHLRHDVVDAVRGQEHHRREPGDRAGQRRLQGHPDRRRPPSPPRRRVHGGGRLRRSDRRAHRSREPGGRRAAWGRGNMVVLPAGQIPPNPTLEQQFDYVLFDAPPLLPVTDAAILSKKASGAILAVASGKTHKGQLAAAVASLENVGAPIAGFVITMMPVKGPGAYGYGRYGYGYGYGLDEEEPPQKSTKSPGKTRGKLGVVRRADR